MWQLDVETIFPVRVSPIQPLVGGVLTAETHAMLGDNILHENDVSFGLVSTAIHTIRMHSGSDIAGWFLPDCWR